jgi:pyruvate ferredoxin oxidoreductase gamma subunit
MYQVRFHGRGGQGVVTAAELLSVAAFMEGRHAQAFPSFGSERMGAPVAAFCRISDNVIRIREPVATPDALIVQDSSLVRNPDLLAGLDKTQLVLVNTRLEMHELKADQLKSRVGLKKLVLLPATEIALEIIKRNVPNVIMLSAFCAITGLITFDTLTKAIQTKFSGRVAQANIAAAERAWALVGEQGASVPAAQAIATPAPRVLETIHA